jgi:hypothetical protein
LSRGAAARGEGELILLKLVAKTTGMKYLIAEFGQSESQALAA